MNMRYYFVAFSALLLAVSFGIPLLVNAEAGQDRGAGTGIQNTLVNPLGIACNGTNDDCVGNFLGKILDLVIKIGTVVVVLMLVYVGFLFVTAQGNDSKITAARSALLWTVVGALILLGAKAIQVGITETVKALAS